MTAAWLDDVRRPLDVGGRRFGYASLTAAAGHLGADLAGLPLTFRILLENLLRHHDGSTVTAGDIAAVASWPRRSPGSRQFAFHPDRLIAPDSSGLPLLADLAALRHAALRHGLDPAMVEPRLPIHLIVDHSVAAEVTGPDAPRLNHAIEIGRNAERYGFLRWAEGAFRNLRIVPPGKGIIHQVNLEHLARVVCATRSADGEMLHPETLVGADSHTPMINGLGILGFGIGGIEASACALGEPLALALPEVIGCRLYGRPPPGAGGSDIALALTETLRRHGVAAAIVEFFGPGLDALPAPDRATVANMAPEYGAMMAYFPIDAATIAFLGDVGREPAEVAAVECYARAQQLWRDDGAPPRYTRVVSFDLSQAEPALAGPVRPDQRVRLSEVPASFAPLAAAAESASRAPVRDGDVVIAAITSCTSTANPAAMIAAGLLARNAVRAGLQMPPWVKATVSPGSRVVADYLHAFGLLQELEAIGFHLAGYGCMTCIGAAGPLAAGVEAAIEAGRLSVAAVLSGNRNFPGRVHPLVRAGYLAAPALVVAYGLTGTVRRNLIEEPLGSGAAGRPVALRELWPDAAEIADLAGRALTAQRCRASYRTVYDGGPGWSALPAATGPLFVFDPDSEYLKCPPFFEAGRDQGWSAAADILGARALLVLGDDVSTDHISPAGRIDPLSPAGRYLAGRGVQPVDFGTYLARRVNHEVMVRGTFASPRLRNEPAEDLPGGYARVRPTGDLATVHDAAMHYRRHGTPLIVVAGQRYGCGSSRDWAAKGTRLLGVRAVIAESFERIHRANLVGMGVLPLQFPEGVGRRRLEIDGSESFDLTGLAGALEPGGEARLRIRRAEGTVDVVPLASRVETAREAERLAAGGILPHLLRTLRAGPIAA